MSGAHRLERLRASFDTHGLDGLLVSQPESRYYLSGYTGHDLPPRDSAGYLLIGFKAALLLTDPRTTEQAQRESPEFEVVQYGSGDRGPQAVAVAAAARGMSRVGFESIHLPYGIWQEIHRDLPASVDLVPIERVVDDLRIIKDAEELACLQEAIDVLDRCLADVLRRAEPGLTEREVARMVEIYLLEHADGPSFPSIVASGPNASVPHAVPTDRRIGAGEVLKIDIGARARGYCSDMTRTVCFGEPGEARLGELHAIVREAQERAESLVRPGMTGREGDALAREVIDRAGYGHAFVHSLGHGIGLEVHEPPWLSQSRGDEVLRPGMVFSVEPGIYLPGWGGVRIEDLVVLEAEGARVLCNSPKALVVDAGVLSSEPPTVTAGV
ncbi:MAG: Xaa-Pro peptidase family protein [Chloroflexi bacterium]|nr:Xaa-Pro peptidase family protein [Chloroflexota bacterium]